MRYDYVLYIVAIICFIITGAVAAYGTMQALDQNLWIVTATVLGLVFVGVGYTQRPKETISTQMPVAPPPPPTLPKVIEIVEEKPEPIVQVEHQPQPIVEVKPPSRGLLDVKGIKEKRAQQLKAIGIYTVEDLAKASPEDLAAKLKIAPYFTGKWIESAKEIAKKS